MEYTVDDPIPSLTFTSLNYVLSTNRNPYITKETAVFRIFDRISEITNVEQRYRATPCFFRDWHDEILEAYKLKQSSLTHDEQVIVERVLSQDNPNLSDLQKFATCWYKYDPTTTCRWFAVDGLLGNHPKSYAYDAFSPTHFAHNQAVRALYAYCPDPEKLGQIIEKAFLLNRGEPCHADLDPHFETCVGMYTQMVGDMRAIESERKTKRMQMQSGRRKKEPSKIEKTFS